MVNKEIQLVKFKLDDASVRIMYSYDEVTSHREATMFDVTRGSISAQCLNLEVDDEPYTSNRLDSYFSKDVIRSTVREESKCWREDCIDVDEIAAELGNIEAKLMEKAYEFD